VDIPGVDAFGRMTREAAAEVLGCSPGTLANWAVSGVGPKPFKPSHGRRVYYMADEVRSFALSGAQAA
jgi:hypothetical protein